MDDGLIGIRRLYDGLWEPSSWQAGLDAVCADLKAHHLISLVPGVEGSGTDGPVCWAVHVSDQHVDALIRHADELTAFVGNVPLGRVVRSEAVVPDSVLLRTELYRSVIRPMGGHRAVASMPFGGGFLALCRPPAAPAFTGHDIKRLQAMLPHFAATLRLKRHLLAVGMHAAALEAALDQLDVGVLIVARSGRTLYANRSAETAMAAIPDAGRPCTLSRQVREIIAQPDGSRRTISRGPARRPLIVRAIPVSARGSERLPLPPQTSVAVFLRDPEQKGRSAVAELMANFCLTPREASVAELLARDVNLTDAAAALGITRENARIHLKRIFSKTSTRRQAELVSLILRSQP